jgi:signal peptidase I
VFGVRPAMIRQLKRFVGEAYSLPANSMAPGLLEGDYIMTVPTDGRTVIRGARVVFRAWGDTYVKRVVALPGDTIYMRAGELDVNGHIISEPFAVHQEEDAALVNNSDFNWQRAYLTGTVQAGDYHPTASTWGPLVVPPDNVFVLGDNRGLSMDSRYRGFVPQAAITRRPTGIYFSRDPESGTIRWSRIGTKIERD